MNDLPINKDEILKELDSIQQKDLKYSSGRILGSMCTEAHPFGKEVYIKFFDSNLGDPGLFKGTKSIEEKTVRQWDICLACKTESYIISPSRYD